MQKAKAKTGTEEEGNGEKSFLVRKYMFLDERCRLTKNIPICHANTYYFLPIHTIFYPKQFGHRPTPIPNINYPARARSARARRACALRALGLLLADRTPTGGRGEDFLSRQPDFFTETAVTP